MNEPVSRRNFLRAAISRVAEAVGSMAPPSAGPWQDGKVWRFFEISLRVELPPVGARTRLWIPMPLPVDTDYFRSEGRNWTANTNRKSARMDREQGVDMLYAEWGRGEVAPTVDVAFRVALRDRAVDFSLGRAEQALSEFDRLLYTRATKLQPVDGIVRKKALEVIGDAETEIARARAIYDWIIANGYRDAGMAGCGSGDICALLEGGALAGRCADINGLFVGMMRSLGIPAREVFGLRVAPCQWGYQSLGIPAGGVGNATSGQHCRAEFHAGAHGWIPVDPADALKVALDEPPGKLAPTHPKVELAHEKLFGAWEMNWLPLNYAQDLVLPDSDGPMLGHFMYPVAEIDGLRIDSLVPERFTYTISSRML